VFETKSAKGKSGKVPEWVAVETAGGMAASGLEGDGDPACLAGAPQGMVIRLKSIKPVLKIG